MTDSVNWYVVDGLYLGTEMGFRFSFHKPIKTTIEEKTGGHTNTTTVEPKFSLFQLGFFAVPAIRLGWKF